jgi:hypothetical protein
VFRTPVTVLPVLLFLAVGCLALGSDRDLKEEVQEMVEKIAIAAGSRTGLSLTFKTISERDTELLPEIESFLKAGLQRRGYSFGESDSALRVVVTLSNSLQGRLLLAAVYDSAGDQFALVPLKSLDSAAASKSSLFLRTDLLWESDQPILDVTPQSSWLLILTADQVVLLEKRDEHWVEVRRAPVLAPVPASRDPRGRLFVSGSSYIAYLPGTICSGGLFGDFVPQCEPSPASWPLLHGEAIRGFMVANRNYFDGRLQIPGRPALSIHPFLSIAALGNQDPEKGLAAVGTDGRLRIYDSDCQLLASMDRWAEEVTSLDAACGSLVMGVFSREGGEQIQTFRFEGAKARALGAPLDLPGTATALWSARDGRGAVVVVRNPETGRYAAYELEVVCNP